MRAPASESDLAMLARWRAGDRVAGNALFERHFESIYRFFAHKAGDDAGDLLQRTFLACVESRDRFRETSSFRTFLFAIAHHELCGYWRRRARREDVLETTSIKDLNGSASEVLVEKHEQRVLLEALRTIPAEQQLVLELTYWERMTSDEIAEVMGVPGGTAKSRLRRAREALRARIEAIESDQERLRSTLSDLDGWAASLKHALDPERQP